MRTVRLVILLSAALLATFPLGAQTFVFAGDSITDGGWGASGGRGIPAAERNLSDLNHIYGHSYMMLVASDWQSAFPALGLEFHNRGLSGDTLAGLAARWDADVLSLRPDVLSILIGVNDSSRETDLQAWEASYRALLARTRQTLPGCKLVLCTPFLAPVGRFGTREDFPQRSARVREMAAAGSEWYPKHMYNGMLDYHTKTWGRPSEFGYKDFLREVGAWLRVNGEGVYGSRAWTVFGEGDDWRFTCKGGKTVYAFALGGSRPAIASLGTAAGRVRHVEQLGQNGRVRFRQDAGGLRLDVPEGQEAITVYKITLK